MSSSRVPRSIISLILIGNALACATTPGPVLSPVPVEPLPPPGDSAPLPTPLRGPRTLTYRPGINHYQVEQHSIIGIARDTAPPLYDTLVTRAQLVLQLQPGDSAFTRPSPTRILATVNSFTTESVRDTVRSPRQLDAPLTIEIAIGEAHSAVRDTGLAGTLPGSASPSAIDCDLVTEAAKDLIHGLIPIVPETVQIGTTWTSSTTTMPCRGGIVLTITAVSSYRIEDIVDIAGVHIVHILRDTRLTAIGAGSFGTRRITVEGSGSSEALFTYELESGHLTSATARSSLILSYMLPQHREQVTQTGVLHAVRVPPSS